MPLTRFISFVSIARYAQSTQPLQTEFLEKRAALLHKARRRRVAQCDINSEEAGALLHFISEESENQNTTLFPLWCLPNALTLRPSELPKLRKRFTHQPIETIEHTNRLPNVAFRAISRPPLILDPATDFLAKKPHTPPLTKLGAAINPMSARTNSRSLLSIIIITIIIISISISRRLKRVYEPRNNTTLVNFDNITHCRS